MRLSLDLASNASRDERVPVNKKYPIKELLAACVRIWTTIMRKQ